MFSLFKRRQGKTVCSDGDVAQKVAFIICTEAGDLENKSLLLSRSIRMFGGAFQTCPIYSFQPRKGQSLNLKTLREFETLEVEHKDKVLNRDFHDYPLANKPMVCRFAEENFSHELLVFLDSDQIILCPPTELCFSAGYDVAIRPVDNKNIGATDTSDSNYPYWENIFSLLNVNKLIRTQTTVSQENIFGYWNSGMVSVKRTSGIFAVWAENFEKVMTGKLQPETGLFFVEQSVLAATLMQRESEIKELPFGYNYPVHMHRKINDEVRPRELEDLISIHYHKIFDDTLPTDVLNELFGETATRGSKRILWLKDNGDSIFNNKEKSS